MVNELEGASSQIQAISVFGEGTRFHHVGMAVKAISKVLPNAEIYEDPIQKVRVAFLDLHGLPLELVEPQSDDSPVTYTLAQGRSVYHICFEVENVERSLASAKDQGFVVVAEPVPATAFQGRLIAWVYSKTFGLVELVAATSVA